jgi:hypothetical protein
VGREYAGVVQGVAGISAFGRPREAPLRRMGTRWAASPSPGLGGHAQVSPVRQPGPLQDRDQFGRSGSGLPVVPTRCFRPSDRKAYAASREPALSAGELRREVPRPLPEICVGAEIGAL